MKYKTKNVDGIIAVQFYNNRQEVIDFICQNALAVVPSDFSQIERDRGYSTLTLTIETGERIVIGEFYYVSYIGDDLEIMSPILFETLFTESE